MGINMETRATCGDCKFNRKIFSEKAICIQLNLMNVYKVRHVGETEISSATFLMMPLRALVYWLSVIMLLHTFLAPLISESRHYAVRYTSQKGT